MSRIQVSFKDNVRENMLYKEVKKAYDKSAFVKECIAFYLANKDKNFNLDAKESMDYKVAEEKNDLSDVDWDF
ncbi:MAG: hypothetical protein RR657_07085 [Peptostreptococcaceae bacterium]